MVCDSSPDVTKPPASRPAALDREPIEPRTEAYLRASVLALAAGPAIGVGIARFAYAVLLPDMAADLHWSYAQGGLVNGFNAAGYIAGALLAAPLIRRVGSARILLGSTMACILALSGSAFLRVFDLIVLARLITGVCGAFAFIAGADLATQVSQGSRRSPELLVSLFYVGPGLGILVTGLTLPLLQSRLGAGSWQTGWAVLAGLSLLLGCALLAVRPTLPPSQPRVRTVPALGSMSALLVGYMVFAAGSITYMTFVFAWIAMHGGSRPLEAAFWTLLGLAAVAAPWLWTGVFRRLSGGAPLAVTILACVLGSSIPLFTDAAPALVLSGVVFGLAFFASVASTTLFMTRNLPASARPAGIAAATLAFGVGQTIGPVLTGAVADRVGNLSAGLAIGTGLMLVGGLLALLQGELPSTST